MVHRTKSISSCLCALVECDAEAEDLVRQYYQTRDPSYEELCLLYGMVLNKLKIKRLVEIRGLIRKSLADLDMLERRQRIRNTN